MVKVVKFGGSSLASAEQFAKVGDIIRADESRKYVVPSAPGKRNSKDTKVTDMLYACYAKAEAGEEFRVPLMKIKERYDSIINGLGLKVTLDEEFKTISKNFKEKAGADYAASRGEYLNGILMADYLGYEFIDAAEAVLQIDLALAQGLDFRPRQGNAGFIRFMDKIIVTGLAVVRNIFHTFCR